MKKRIMNLALAAMVVAGVATIELNPYLSLAFIGIAGGVMALSDLRKPLNKSVKEYTIDELLDIETFGEE